MDWFRECIFFIKAHQSTLETKNTSFFLASVILSPRNPQRWDFFARETSWKKVLTLDILQGWLNLILQSYFPFKKGKKKVRVVFT